MFRKLTLIIALLAVYCGSFALPPTYYTSQSRFAKGKWVKIRTTEEGIYQISYDRLREMGFSNPSKVQVYGYGGVDLTAQNSAFSTDFPDDIQPVATAHTADGRILFYGQGDVNVRTSSISDSSESSLKYYRNPYDTRSYYFLSDLDNGKYAEIPQLGSVKANTNLQPVSSHIHVDLFEQEVQNPTHGGVVFHGPSHSDGETVDYKFAIRDYRPSPKYDRGSFYYKYAVLSEKSVGLTTVIPSGFTKKSSSNSSAQPPEKDVIAYNNATGSVTFVYDSYPALGVSRDFTFSVKIPSSANSYYCAEDYVILRYPRANYIDADSPFIVMNFGTDEKEKGQTVTFDGVNNGDLQVWSIDAPTPKAFATTFADGGASIVLDGSNSTAIAFKPSLQFPTPEVVGQIANQNLHAQATPDMVIFTVAAQAEAAQKLADIHKKYQNLDVLVVVHDQAYNEFSSGTRHAMAYRRLAKMFYDRDPKKFRFIMFMGPAFYDNRNVLGPEIDRLVCYEQDHIADCNDHVRAYAADQYFAMLADDYNHSKMIFTPTSVNVGRVSAIDASQAFNFVNKVENRFLNPLPPEVFNHILLMAGSGDATKHSQQSNEIYRSVRSINPTISMTAAHNESFSLANPEMFNTNILAALTRGAGMMNYIGHGSPTTIAGWSVSEARSADYTYAPFVMFASCDQYAFDHLANGIVETMLTTDATGSLGGVAASRSVYIDENQKTCLYVSNEYAKAKYGDTFGDIFRRSRDVILEEYRNSPIDFPLYERSFNNLLAYNLAGDPAVPIGAPEYSVTLNTIGGNATNKAVTVEPYRNVKFEGVVSLGSRTASNFNGTVRIEVLDGAHIVKTNN